MIKILLWVLCAGCLSSLVTYIVMCDQRAKKQQKKRVARFVTRMKKLVKEGKTENIERSIKIFSAQCMGFYPKVFLGFKQAEFSDIADAVLDIDSQKFAYGQFQDNGIGALPSPDSMREYKSESEIHKRIVENFRKIIFV